MFHKVMLRLLSRSIAAFLLAFLLTAVTGPAGAQTSYPDSTALGTQLSPPNNTSAPADINGIKQRLDNSGGKLSNQDKLGNFRINGATSNYSNYGAVRKGGYNTGHTCPTCGR